MKRKYLIGLSIAILIMATACNGTSETKVPAEQIVVETTLESIKEAATNSDMMNEHVQTLGIYRSSTKSTAANEPYMLVTFTDAAGNDFIATISNDTITPEELKEGKTYVVEHTAIMTRSLPGIYPQVFSILESNEELISSADKEYETNQSTQ